MEYPCLSTLPNKGIVFHYFSVTFVQINLETMKKIAFLITIMFVVLSHSAWSQTTASKTAVKGVVLDNETGEKLIGALVVIQGTSVGGISDAQGVFNIKGVEKGKEVKIEISYVGYASQVLTVNTRNDVYEFKTPVRLKVEGIKIKDVNVMGSAPVAKIKGDTTQFNAGAYKVNPDATAGDLLAKMPGFEKNDDGTVSSQGEKVQRVYVDGKSFFKNDLATALNSLPAGMVEGIEMFDDKSDKSKFTGFDDGSTVKSINIVTKNRLGEKPTGLFEATAGYGYDNVYMGSLNFTRLSGDRQISISGGSNNINISPIQERRGFGRGGGGGINTQSAAAINFTNSLKNDGEINVSYTYKRSDKETESFENRTYFPSKDYTNYIYESITNSKNISDNHNFSLDLESNLGEKTRITFRPTGSLSYSDNYSKSYNNSMMDGDTTRNDRINSSTPNSYSVGGDLSLMRKFSENSFITFNLNGRFQNSSSDSYLEGETIYDKLTSESDSVYQHQMSDNLSNTNNVGAGVEYTKRVSRSSGISFGYDFDYNWSDSDKRTYLWDEMEGRYIDLDSTLSNNFQRDYMTNGVGTRYNYKTETTTFNFGVKYQNAQMVNERLFPEPNFKRDYAFDGAVIETEFRYRKTKEGGNFYIGYSGEPNYPSVEQLQDVLNNDNPLQLSSGNPNLKQSFNNNVSLRYRGANVEKSLFWSVFGRLSNTMNGVVNNTILYQEAGEIELGGIKYQVREGAQYTSLVNMNGTWNASIGGMFSFPLEVIKTKINVMASYNFNKRPSMYNNVEYSSTENGIGLNIGFNSNINENVDFSINNSINYRMTKSNRVDDNTNFTENLRVNFNWIIWNGFFVNANYNMNYQKLSNTPLEKPYTNMLNAAVGKKFGNDKFEVRASVYDALNQNRNIEQKVSDIYVADIIANNLTRYFSVSFTYKFNSMKKDLKSMGGRGPGGHGHGGRTTM